MDIHPDFLDRFIEGLSELFGSNCEIVVHDFSNGFEHTIVKIINSMTGRTVGDAPTNLFFERMRQEGRKLKDFPVYYINTDDGRTLKAFATFIRNDAGEAVGAVCVKLDVTGLMRISEIAAGYLGGDTVEQPPLVAQKELHTHSLDELMDYYLAQVEKNAGKSATMMSKAEKMQALDYLDQKGVLHMSKANVRLCEFFDFSKFTLYNYLEIIRAQRADKGETDI